MSKQHHGWARPLEFDKSWIPWIKDSLSMGFNFSSWPSFCFVCCLCVCVGFLFFLPSQSGDTKYVLELLWYFVWKTQIEKHCIPFKAETWDLVIYVTGDLYDLHTLVMLLQSVSPPLLLLACCWQALLYCKHLSLFAAHLRGVIAYPLCMKREFFC